MREGPLSSSWSRKQSIPFPSALRVTCGTSRFIIEDEPSDELLEEMEIEDAATRCSGLYQGTPLNERHWDHGNSCPIASRCFSLPSRTTATVSEDEVVARNRETLIHELGHYFGMSGRGDRRRRGAIWRKRPVTTKTARDESA